MRTSRDKIINSMIGNYNSRPALRNDFDSLFLHSIPSNVSSYYDKNKNTYDTLVEIENKMQRVAVMGDHAFAIMFGLSYCLFMALKYRVFEMGFEPPKQKPFFTHFLRTQNSLVDEPDLYKRLLILQSANEYCENYDKKFNYAVDKVTYFGALESKQIRFLVPSEGNIQKHKSKLVEA